MRRSRGDVAVALHDVEPATYERCALIRDWLGDHGIDRVTLLVIPACDLHPFADRRPEMVAWLVERVAAGDTVAQHGFQHRQARPGRRGPAREAAEFVGLDEAETRRAVAAGRRLLRLAGVEPRGFIAPAYAYPPSLRRTLATTFDWWAGSHRVWSDHGRRSAHAPALRPRRGRLVALPSGSLLRLDLHPADFDRPRTVGGLERVLRRTGGRQAVTYDELAQRGLTA